MSNKNNNPPFKGGPEYPKCSDDYKGEDYTKILKGNAPSESNVKKSNGKKEKAY